MKGLFIITKQFFAEIWSDAMLIVLLFAPVLMGCAFRFGIPALEGLLCERLSRTAVIAPYYPLFDLLLSLMTPMMFAFSGAMVVLSENDTGLACAIAVTPVGRSGYLLSRIFVPALLSALWCAVILAIFKLSKLSILQMFLLSAVCAVLGAGMSLMVVSLAKNKVEGLALTKLSGLMLLGIPSAILIPPPAQYIAGILPSLWMSKAVMESSSLYMLPALAVSLCYCALFYKSFVRKLLS